MVGKLEAFVLAKPSLPPAEERPQPSSESVDDLKARINALEIDIGDLSAQLEIMAGQLEAAQKEKATAAAAPEPPSEPEVTGALPAPPKEDPVKEEAAKAEPPKEVPTKMASVKEETSVKDETPTPDRSPETKTATIANPEPRPRPEPEPEAEKKPESKIAPPDRKPEVEEVAAVEPEDAGEEAPVPPSLAPVVPPDVETADPSKPRWYGTRPDAAETPKDEPKKKKPSRRIATYPSAGAQALYEEGYGDYLQRDYAGAERAFRKLVSGYPNDPLAGSAQYWVGETQYVRKQYQKAADSFLNGYRQYSGSDKAPDTLLRLGMSLAALGKTKAACDTFEKLGDRFPDSSQQRQAASAAGKAGCQ